MIAFAARRRLPALYGTGGSDLVRDGGLMSYGTNIDVQYPRAADYVDKILKGASPSELRRPTPNVRLLVPSPACAPCEAGSRPIPSLIFRWGRAMPESDLVICGNA